MRRCALTGARADRSSMVRFVRDAEGRVVPDIAERLPGRGVWLTARGDVVTRAARKNAFARGLGLRRPADAGIAEEVERLLVRRALDLIGLARRAGEAVTGFERVRAMLSSGHAGLLLHARDGSMDGAAKLGRGPVRLFDGEELGRPFGRARAVHVALANGKLAASVAREVRRLGGFRDRSEGACGTTERRR